MPFHAAVAEDRETRWSLVTLRYDHPRDPTRTLAVRIVPEAGSNLFSFKVGTQELLVQPDRLADLIHHHAGTPIMFPTPNRVHAAKMTFEGRRFAFKANHGDHFIHGLVRHCAFGLRHGPRVTDRNATATLVLDWDRRQSAFAQFPIRHQLTMTYTLGKQGLRIGYRVHNRDHNRLPYGFGLHPYFRVPGARGDVFLQVPLAHRMEAIDLIPTGALLSVKGTPYDLRQPQSLSRLNLDDVYWGMTPTRRAQFTLRRQKLSVLLKASKEFTHVVVFTPPGRPYFCIENQTSSTDAHNLWTRGQRRESHLLVIPPGKTTGGFVDWHVRRK